MEIKVSEILPEGKSVEITENPEDLADLGEEVRASGPVVGRFRIKKVGVTVYLAGDVEARLELVCSRCGKAYTSDAGSKLELDLNPAESVPGEDERELHPGEMEVEFYRDDKIDLSALMREQVLLQVPMKPLCNDECLGLCQYCGQDKNEGQCSCEPPTGHPGLARLKDLLNDKN